MGLTCCRLSLHSGLACHCVESPSKCRYKRSFQAIAKSSHSKSTRSIRKPLSAPNTRALYHKWRWNYLQKSRDAIKSIKSSILLRQSRVSFRALHLLSGCHPPVNRPPAYRLLPSWLEIVQVFWPSQDIELSFQTLCNVKRSCALQAPTWYSSLVWLNRIHRRESCQMSSPG